MSEVAWESVEASLQPLREMLEADGFELRLARDGADGLAVAVDAGPNACEECLVPEDIFTGLVRQFLSEQIGPSSEALRISVEYPQLGH